MNYMSLLSFLGDVFHHIQVSLFELIVSPSLRALDLAAFTEPAFDATELFLIGVLQIAAMWLILRPLELWRPAEAVESIAERRTDVWYTLLHRLGGFALLSFAIISPILDSAEGGLRLLGIGRVQIDQLLGLSSQPLLLFFIYLIVLDFADYWIHRAQHRLNLWWQLHALHHANTRMSLWSDNRNHMLDDLLRDCLLAVVSWFIGVEPAQYLVWVAVGRMLQSLQHANVRLPFGWLGERLIVSPYFHRVHHGVSSGEEGRAAGCNFGVLLPWWDIVFGTAKYNAAIEPTGVRDQATGRQYGEGFWQQQYFGVLRLIGKA